MGPHLLQLHNTIYTNITTTFLNFFFCIDPASTCIEMIIAFKIKNYNKFNGF